MENDTIQIDVVPTTRRYVSDKVNLYISGYCFSFMASKDTIDAMVHAGIVKQVKGQKLNAMNQIETFDYLNGVDSTGVKYTSSTYEIIKKP
jgi:hypothetical protein